jgi:hypothetical protein
MKIRKLTKKEVRVCVGVGAGLLIAYTYKLISSYAKTNNFDIDVINEIIQNLTEEELRRGVEIIF